MVIHTSEYTYYNLAKKYFVKKVTDEVVKQILRACIADLKRILIKTYTEIKAIHVQTHSRTDVNKKISRHYEGVLMNLLLKAFRDVVHESALNSKNFKNNIQLFLVSEEATDLFKTDVPTLVDMTFVSTNNYIYAHTLGQIFEQCLAEIDLNSIKPSKDAISPYISMTVIESMDDIYEELILDNI